MKGDTPTIYSDGTQSRDFTYIANVVNANLAASQASQGIGSMANCANGERISLNELLDVLKKITNQPSVNADFQPERKGDVKHSQADNSRAVEWFNYKACRIRRRPDQHH